MSAAPGSSLSVELSAAALRLGGAPEESAAAAENILAAVPGQQQALLLLVSALRLTRDLVQVRTVLERLVDANPGLAAIRYELGLVLSALGLHREAAAQFAKVVESEPNHPSAWRALGNAQAASGDTAGAARAYARQLKSSLRELQLVEEAARGSEEEVAKAENMLRQSLAINPTDVMSSRMLAQRELWLGRHRAAGKLLANVVRLVPDFVPARQEYAFALQQDMQWRAAIAQQDIVLEREPDNTLCESHKAWNLVMLGNYEEAFRLFDKVGAKLARSPAHWMNYGHALRTVGRTGEAAEAYRKALALEPALGAAWWSLANLNSRFSAAEIRMMQAQLKDDDGSSAENRCHLEFALAAALEAEGAWAESFEHYRAANSLRRPRLNHDPAQFAELVARYKALYTREFFRARRGSGCQASDPIFIVGMPRAGSTLVEQILSSHSAVEGTAELPEMPAIVMELGSARQGIAYPEIVAELDAAALRARGEQYLEETRFQRKLGRPFFTDKAPLNFQHIGLIALILPKAKIIDARRHPMACCYSGYRHCFHMGSMPHTYDLAELGLFYRNYVALMAHYDSVLPGRVHRVFHEDMVRAPEREIRRLLDHCGLPFEESCLRFHETRRGVRTYSSEQVRRPIYTPDVEPWRQCEAWLGPLREALGNVLDAYPAVPEL